MALLLAGGTTVLKHMLPIFSMYCHSIMHIRSALVSWGLSRLYSTRVVFQKNRSPSKAAASSSKTRLFEKRTSLLSHHHCEIHRSVL